MYSMLAFETVGMSKEAPAQHPKPQQLLNYRERQHASFKRQWLTRILLLTTPGN